jgi:PAS domain S-box-containing protein
MTPRDLCAISNLKFRSTASTRRSLGSWEERRTADGGIGVRIDITELKRREALPALFDSNPIPMWLFERASLRFLAVNDAAIAHYGYSREQFLAMTLLDIRPPSERERVRLDLKKRANDLPQGRARRHIKADGTQIDVSIYAQDLQYENRDARLVAVIDITAKKQAEKELLRAQEFLNAIIENVPAAIYVKELAEFRYILVNRAGEQFFSRPREEIVGKTPYDFFPRDAADTIVARDRQALQDDQDQIYDENPIHSSVSGWEKVSVRGIVIRDADNNPQYLLTVIENLTGQRQAEARAAHLARHDALTDLPNRAAFNQHFETTLKRSAAANESFALMSIDLDRFKEINDLFGHSVGDALLCEVSRRLQAAMGGAFVARLGGDEFVAISTPARKLKPPAKSGGRAAGVIGWDFEIEGQHLRVSLEHRRGDLSDRWNRRYHAARQRRRCPLLRQNGRARHRALLSGDMDKRLREQRALHHDLSSAIERRGSLFCITSRRRRSGRGHRPGGADPLESSQPWPGPAGMFIPIAEETGLILPIANGFCARPAAKRRPGPNPCRSRSIFRRFSFAMAICRRSSM